MEQNVVPVSIVVITFLIFLVFEPITVSADRTFTKVYEPIEGTTACFKRLNGTHEIGCRSSASGDVGVIHLIEDQQSLDWVLKDGPHSPYIAVVYPEHFTRSNINQFKYSKRVEGVLLLKEKGKSATGTSLKKFSSDSTCPNEGFGVYNRSSPNVCPMWNEPGNNLLWENFDFPIIYVQNDTESEKILKCFNKFNRPVNQTAQDWPLCAAQLKAFMLAAKNTPTCLRRSGVFSITPGASRVCDQLGDQNLWGSLFPQNTTSENDYPNNSVIVIGARLDGASIFDEISPSADTSVSGLVTVLSIIKHLASVKDELLELLPESSIKNVVFMLFNGEAFGYIGSSRIVYDMNRNEFPLKLEHIRYFIEINQAALRNPEESYFIHQSDLSQSKELTDLIENLGRTANVKVTTVPKSSSSWGLPSASLQSFLREKADLTGVVITNHEKSYRNQFYNSMFDDKEKMEYSYGDDSVYSVQQKIASLAAALANSIIHLISSTQKKVQPDIETVDELLHCYLETSNCTTFYEILNMSQPVEPYKKYVGVYTHINTMTKVTKLLLVSYLGNLVENLTSADECWKQHERGYNWLNGSCWESLQVNMTDARSPAFLIDNYDWKSGRYSTWTESIWQKFTVRIFVKPSLFHELMTLISGIVVVIVSFGVVRTVNIKADSIFNIRADAMVG